MLLILPSISKCRSCAFSSWIKSLHASKTVAAHAISDILPLSFYLLIFCWTYLWIFARIIEQYIKRFEQKYSLISQIFCPEASVVNVLRLGDFTILYSFLSPFKNTTILNRTSVYFEIPKILSILIFWERYSDEKNIGFCSIKRAWQQFEKDCPPIYKQIYYLRFWWVRY